MPLDELERPIEPSSCAIAVAFIPSDRLDAQRGLRSAFVVVQLEEPVERCFELLCASAVGGEADPAESQQELRVVR